MHAPSHLSERTPLKRLPFALLLLLALAPAARAQFVGGAAPAGADKLVFTVPGAAHAAGLSTIFTCTNPNGGTANIAVETFDHNGAQQNASPALAVPPGGTVQFATTPTAPFSPDQYLNPVTNFTEGAAKIWSDAKKLQCGAERVAIIAGISAAMVKLTVVARGKTQKGD